MNILGDRLRGFQVSKSEAFFLIVFGFFGALSVFIIPVGAGNDEESHILRIWEMSAFEWIPNEKLESDMPFPKLYWDLSYRRSPIVRVVEEGFWDKYASLPIGAYDYIYTGMTTRSVFSPPLLLPQTIVMRYLGRAQDLPALTVFYVSRLAGMATYMTLAWISIRMIPFGKWMLAILAASPMAIFHASTINADAISAGFALVFVAGCLAVADRETVGWRELGILLMVSAVLFLAKVNSVALIVLPFIILRPSRFSMRGGYAILMIGVLTLAAVEVGGWNLIGYSRFRDGIDGSDAARQLSYVLNEPLGFIQLIARDFANNIGKYSKEWIGEYGYGYWTVPFPTHILYSAALALAVVFGGTKVRPDIRTRLGLGLGALAGYFTTVIVLYIALNPVANDQIVGVNGRYLVGIAPALFLALLGLPAKVKGWRAERYVSILSAVSLAIFVVGMHLSYHVSCGTKYYTSGLCYQPLYKNWGPNDRYSQPISDRLRYIQEFSPECDGATEARVWLDSSEASLSGSTEFTLQDVDENRELTSAIVLNRDLPNGHWVTLKFPPDWDSNEKLYRMSISSGEKSAERGPRLALTIDKQYERGTLFDNEDPVPYDLVFQYGCIAGLEATRSE